MMLSRNIILTIAAQAKQVKGNSGKKIFASLLLDNRHGARQQIIYNLLTAVYYLQWMLQVMLQRNTCFVWD